MDRTFPVEWVEKYIGIPYETHGRSFDGCDCWGLVVLVYRDVLGIILPSFSAEYECESNIDEVSKIIEGEKGSKTWERIDSGNEKCFDIAEMFTAVRTNRGWKHVPLHIGIITVEKWLLHTEIGSGAALMKYDNGKRIKNIWRYKHNTSNIQR